MKLESDVALLQRQPLLALLEIDALRLLAFAAESRILRAGDTLFREGEPSDGAFLVVSGSIALSHGDNGAPAEEIAGAGSLIGEMALFTSIARPGTAMAREPSQILKLPMAIMQRVLVEFPESAQRIALTIRRRLGIFAREIRPVGAALDAIDRP
jgi:CRP-like cAMP-binding protein